jgi:hypothetical protein
VVEVEEVGEYVLVGVPLLHGAQVGEHARGQGLQPAGCVGGRRDRGGAVGPRLPQFVGHARVLRGDPDALAVEFGGQADLLVCVLLGEAGAFPGELVGEPGALAGRLLGEAGLFPEQSASVLGDRVEAAEE